MELWLKTGTMRKRPRSPPAVSTTPEGSTASSPSRTTGTAHEPTSNLGMNPVSHVPATCSAKKQPKEISRESVVKQRKYDPTYIKWGFVSVGKEHQPDGLCVVCQQVLCNSSLAPAKLQRHLTTHHPDLVTRSSSYFERLAKDLVLCQQKLRFDDNLRKPHEVSFRIAYEIGRAGESHTIGERLVKPCMLEAAKCLFDGKQVKAIESIPLADNTVGRRIADISAWLENQICDDLSSSPFWAMQLDESTDVSGMAILLVFVRYFVKSTMQEELLMCRPLQTNATGEAIFNEVNGYLSSHGLSWDNCVDLCTDGAAAMTGRQKGFVRRVQQVARHITSTHCILHREALAAKRIPPALKAVLDEATKVVNFIKSRPLQSRVFKILCEEMGAAHTALLLHTEVRWLSRGRVLTRLFELRSEVVVFSMDHHLELFDKFRDVEWLQRLAYLADVFDKLNGLNAALQGKSANIFTSAEKITAMKRKVELWNARVQTNEIDCFSTLQEFIDENNINLDKNVKSDITAHLTQLSENLEKYFPAESMAAAVAHPWIRNPFSSASVQTSLASSQAEQLIELQNSASFKEKFLSSPLPDFWAGAAQDFPDLSALALRVLVPFVTTYLSETAFSVYAATKTKYRSCLNAEHDMRLQLSQITPDFAQLTKHFQYQVSH
jgi:zinc finger BED domain-containing protein 5/7/8/9